MINIATTKNQYLNKSLKKIASQKNVAAGQESLEYYFN